MDHLTRLLVNYQPKILTVEWHGFIVYSAGITAMVANLADADFRKEYRASVVATHMITEVRRLLENRTSSNTTITLGPACPDVDFVVLGLDLPRKNSMTYCMKARNMQELDGLLGAKWDVAELENCVQFVTQIKFSVVSQPFFVINASVAASQYEGKLHAKPSYRKQLLDHFDATEQAIIAHAEPPLADDTAEQCEVVMEVPQLL